MKKKSLNLVLAAALVIAVGVLVLSFSSVSLNSQQIWSEKKQVSAAVKNSDIYKAKNVFVDLTKEVNPAVVNIFTSHTVKMREQGYYDDEMFKMLEQFMGRQQMGPGQRMMPRERKSTALGSGFILNKDGFIVTNNHVIDGADKISVKLSDGKEYEAKLIGADTEIDVALIKINAKKDLPFAYLGDSSKTEVGEWVIAIGNPVGQSNTVTAGIVSAKGRLLPDINMYSDFIQTDAAINPGNSGGPLVNINGEVIGINTAINRQMGFVPIEGIGFAIPINNVKQNLLKLARGEKIIHKHGWLGVSLTELSDEISQSLKLKNVDFGAVVTEVMPNTPAQKAGMKPYDVIVSFDGQETKTAIDLSMAVKRAQGGKTYPVEVIRNNSKIKLNVVLTEKKADEQEDNLEPSGTVKPGKDNSGSAQKSGIYLEKTKDGIVVKKLDGDSSAAMAGLQEGDVVLEVNRQVVTDSASFYRAYKNKGMNMLRVKRGNATVILAFNAG